MKKHRIKFLALGLLSALAVDAGTPACAFNLHAAINRNGGFMFNSMPIENEMLDDMRGGFITTNGMVIDFAFSANTLIDGELINQVVLNTAELATGAHLLRNIIQVGEGNIAFGDAIDTGALPNILTVVQNNLDNLTLQQFNILDLNIQNMDNFFNRSMTPEIDFQNTIRLVP